MVIGTDRLIIRPIEERDTDMIVSWRNTDRIQRTLETEGKITRRDQLQWYHNRKGRVDYLVIIDKPIGVWSYKKSDEMPGLCMEQGRYIGEDQYLGKGYGREASNAWLMFGFMVLHLDYIVALHRKENDLPQRMNEKAGFVKYYDGPDFVKYYMDRNMFSNLDKSGFSKINFGFTRENSGVMK